MTHDLDLQKMDAGLPDGSHDALSVEERRSLHHCYDEGMKLMQQAKYDNDRVHGLLLQCVLRDPGNLMYVDALLANLVRRFGNRSQVPRVQLFTGKGPLQKAANQAEWDQVLRNGPDVLKHNPWDVDVLWAMIQACAAREFSQAELRYLQQALDAETTDTETNRRLARHSLAAATLKRPCSVGSVSRGRTPTMPKPPGPSPR